MDYVGIVSRRIPFLASPPASSGGRQCVNITILEDTIAEGDKEFSVKLQTDPNDPVVTLGTTPLATITIVSNDPGEL